MILQRLQRREGVVTEPTIRIFFEFLQEQHSCQGILRHALLRGECDKLILVQCGSVFRLVICLQKVLDVLGNFCIELTKENINVWRLGFFWLFHALMRKGRRH